MNILFLSLSNFESYEEKGIYTDVLRNLIELGHSIYSIMPSDSSIEKYKLIKEDGNYILKVKTGQVVGNSNLIKKAFSLLSLSRLYKKAFKKYFNNVKFDLILYVTPPITIYSAIKKAKKKYNAKTYLLLKDIFPQNAIDIGFLSEHGIKRWITRYFKTKEKKYYNISDIIGCMSPRNKDYLLLHNSEIKESKVVINPNSIDFINEQVLRDKNSLIEKYNIPKNAKIFIYGGNLGRPQNIPFIIECLKDNDKKTDRFFIISGKGSDFNLLEKYIKDFKPNNVFLINGLSRKDYDNLVVSCDVGLIFLDYRFTIPNYPSRVLSYMQYKLPVLACIDNSTDIGDDIVRGGFGWKCNSNEIINFTEQVDKVCAMEFMDIEKMGENGASYLVENFSAKTSAKLISEFILDGKNNGDQ